MDGNQFSSPAIGDKGVYVVFPCIYYKLRQSDGVQRWQDGNNCGGGGSTPVYFDKKVIVREPSGQFPNSILDADTGETLGTFPVSASNLIPALYSSAGRNFMVYAAGSSLINYDITNPSAITTAWSVSLGGQQLSSAPIVVSGYVVEGTFSGDLYVLSASNGKTVWHTNLGVPVAPTNESDSNPTTGMAAGNGILVVPGGGAEDGDWTLFAFAPDITSTHR